MPATRRDQLRSLRDELATEPARKDAAVAGGVVAALAEILEGLADVGLFTGPDAVAEDLAVALARCNSGPAADTLASTADPKIIRRLGQVVVERLNETGDDADATAIGHEILDLVRRRPFLRKIAGDKEWEQLILEILRASRFDIAALFDQRVRDHADDVLFTVLRRNRTVDHTFRVVDDRVRRYRRGLAALLQEVEKPDGKIAFLLENSVKMAELDLACLTSGIVNAMIPANSPTEHIALILNETRAPILLVHDDRQLSRLKSIQATTPHLQQIVLVRGASAADDVMTLAEMIDAGHGHGDLRADGDPDALATLMYTSGTTGKPKGIMFSRQNIVYKRFCRALALPEIGSDDRFLSFLPLFHTFGRWLEMLGCLFWGATYIFLDNPAVDTIIDGMRRVRPTVFISIPKKWQQLYEVITTRVDPEIDADDDIKGAVEEVTGGALRWGLSAAGYLPPEVFRFFQRYGTELMSGFGMTEATGGITLTPPGHYRDESLGKALPGIEIKLADDGELLLRGPYVMQGYYGTDRSELADGWLHSGDIMTMSSDGFIEIVDRKKEIYKNSRGETIAPQRVENLFADFEAVHQVFLVGDHRPHNTLLIHPNMQADGGILNDMGEEHRRAYFASLVVSVNGFLMPYERVVDFRLIDRPFSAEQGELTPKGTFKRRAIEQNFDSIISPMYERNTTSFDWQGIEVRVPNWFFRENGCLIGDIVATPEGMSIPKLNRRLKLARVPGDDRLLRIGDFLYQLDGGLLDLQRLVTDPLNWLGNYDLFHFVGGAIIAWYRAGRGEAPITLHGRAESRAVPTKLQKQFSAILYAGERSLHGLHLAVLHLQSDDEALGKLATNYLRGVIDDEGGAYRLLASEITLRPKLTSLSVVRREMMLAGLRLIDAPQLQRLLGIYLDCDSTVFDSDAIRRIVTTARTEEHLAAIEDTLATRLADPGETSEGVVSIAVLFDLLVDFAIRHPTRIQRVRRTVVQCQLQTESEAIAHIAGKAREHLLEGRRKWFGENKRVAIDVETGEDYTWADVISFEEGLDPDDRARLLRALEETCVVRESIFLFSGGRVVGLHDLPRGGIWVTHLGSRHGKSVYRVKVQTRHHGSFDMALNLSKELPAEEVSNEVDLLIAAGGMRGRARLVEEFGGFWEEMQLWSEEYVPGETVARFLRRKTRKDDDKTRRRLFYLWPYFVWCAAEAFVGLLTRTGFRVELAEPSPYGIIVPPHDYQAGTRIVSISDRLPFESLRAFFTRFYASFVRATEEKLPALVQGPMWRYVFAGVLESEGEQAGLELLHTLQDECTPGAPDEETMQQALAEVIALVENAGFVPKRLHFAIARFHRWFEINRDAALSAQAQTLAELNETYGLRELEDEYPGARTRLFLETVFAESPEPLRRAVDELTRRQHHETLSIDDVLTALSAIQEGQSLDEDDAFFFARLSFPHVRPTDSVELQQTLSNGAPMVDLVVCVEDHDGAPFSIRRPTSPREISRLHQLFFKERLHVDFRPEHRFLVGVSERGHIIGGVYYLPPLERIVHMEKIVVSDHFRRKGIGEALLNELMSRVRDQGVRHVTTGFFRPEYFYRMGFKVGPRYAGLVKDL